MFKYKSIFIQLILLCSIFTGAFGENDVKVDIFIKSYHADFKWLDYCVKSIDKFVKNVNKIIIVIPKKDSRYFNINLSPKFELHKKREVGKGYLFQQYVKLTAHHYSDADYIMFVDSDCIFLRETDLVDLVKDGKSRMLMTKYSEILELKDQCYVWKAPTEKVFNTEVEYEFMRSSFLIYKRSTLQNFEKWFPYDLLTYIISQEHFSEYNVLGAFAYFFERDQYNFVDTQDWTDENPFGRQYWSYSGLTNSEREEIESILK